MSMHRFSTLHLFVQKLGTLGASVTPEAPGAFERLGARSLKRLAEVSNTLKSIVNYFKMEGQRIRGRRRTQLGAQT